MSSGVRRRSVLRPVVEACVLVGMVLAPVGIWHSLLNDELASFHLNLRYFVDELGPWLLLLAGIAFLVPVAVSAGLHPESRLYPRGRKTYATWGTVLYLLGVLLMVEVSEVWNLAH